ncbi:MAG: hypothetical protein Q4E35_04510 [Eubacteriales bacterium]|nr:hypothetical protein [Eubacteriales bacterium]
MRIAKRSAPINVIVHLPKTDTGKQALAKRVSEVHADTVIQTVNKLNCSTEQKSQLLDSIIKV